MHVADNSTVYSCTAPIELRDLHHDYNSDTEVAVEVKPAAAADPATPKVCKLD